MILVTGATGTVGRQVVEQLVAADQPVRALARDPERSGLSDGVELVAGDLSDAIGLAPHLHDQIRADDVVRWAAEHADDFR